MGETSGISWMNSTWNPWRGCRKVSPGCAHCYMFRDMKRYGNDPEKIVRSKTTFADPLIWKQGRKIFVCSWSDFFVEEADGWRDEAWDIMRRSPQHTFQLCTKRPERIVGHLPKDWGNGYPNVWLGVTGENQKMFDERVAILATIPAAIRWVSIEPALERVLVSPAQAKNLNWVVIGGESGSGARPFDPNWIGDLLYRRFSLFVKQMGSNPVGLKLKHPHGADPSEWNPLYQVQEFPL